MPRRLLLALLPLLGVHASAQEALEITASKEGYRPATLRLRKGETTRVSLKTSDEEHCFAVNALRIEKRIRPGKATTFDLTPEKAGEFPYYCCLEPDNPKLRGRLVVAE
ncbi:MAG TPA: cupredoxin domain-containing protein [Vicinamibacteria bacterium]|nr:cupredoxin domain-containing protein [Vicinamibacteria bacterium]